MARYIVKLGDRYLEWSSVVDAPASYGASLEEFREAYREEYGTNGMAELDQRLARVEAKGTSSVGDESADDTLWLNRAGPGEKPLAKEEMIEFFCRRQEEPTEETLSAFRAEKGTPCDPCPQNADEEVAERCDACWGSFVRYG